MANNIDLSDYIKEERPFASGGFGAAYLYKPRDGRKEPIVVKRLRLDEGKITDDLIAETRTAVSLNSQYLIKVHDSFIESDGNSGLYANMVMEYCNKGTLDSCLRKFLLRRQPIPHQELKEIALSTLYGLDYLAKRNLVHRDIKPANIMKKGKTWKLGDFGLLRKADPRYGTVETSTGTPQYVSPEIYLEKKASHKSDIFALGVTFLELMMLHNGYSDHICGGALNKKNIPQLNRPGDHALHYSYECIAKPYKPTWTSAQQQTYPAELIKIVERMIEFKPEDRPTASEILATPLFTAYANELHLRNDVSDIGDSFTTIVELEAKIQKLLNKVKYLEVSNRQLTDQLKALQDPSGASAPDVQSTLTRTITITTLEKNQLNFRSAFVKRMYGRSSAPPPKQESLVRMPAPSLFTRPAYTVDPRIRTKVTVISTVGTVAFAELEIQRNVWRVEFYNVGNRSPGDVRERPSVPANLREALQPLTNQIEAEKALQCDGYSVGICCTNEVHLFTRRARLLGEETTEDAEMEKEDMDFEEAMGHESVRHQVDPRNKTAGVFSVVYYQSGAVKHGDIVITPDGKKYQTSNTPLQPLAATSSEAQGNAPWTKSDRVTMEIDMVKRVMVFYVNGRRQPVSVSNLPNSVTPGVSLNVRNAEAEVTIQPLDHITPLSDEELIEYQKHTQTILYGGEQSALTWEDPMEEVMDFLHYHPENEDEDYDDDDEGQELLPPSSSDGHSDASEALKQRLLRKGLSQDALDRSFNVESHGSLVQWTQPVTRSIFLSHVFTRGVYRIGLRIQDGREAARQMFEEQESKSHTSARSTKVPFRKKYSSAEEAERDACGRTTWNPVIGGCDAEFKSSRNPLYSLGSDAYSFGIYQTGYLVVDNKYYETKVPFDCKSKVYLELDMNNHICFIIIDGNILPYYISQLPNSICLGASMSTKYSNIRVEDFEEIKSRDIPADFKELPFNFSARLPCFSSIPNHNAINIVPSIISPDSENGGRTNIPTPCTVQWTSNGNATIYQRDALFDCLPFDTPKPPSPSDPDSMTRIELGVHIPSSATPSSQITPNIAAKDALLDKRGAWKAFFGLTKPIRSSVIDDIPKYEELYTQKERRAIKACVHDHISSVPLGADKDSICMTSDGGILFDGRCVGTVQPFYLGQSTGSSEDSMNPVAIEISFKHRTAHFIVNNGTFEEVAFVVKNIPSSLKAAVGGGHDKLSWQVFPKVTTQSGFTHSNTSGVLVFDWSVGAVTQSAVVPGRPLPSPHRHSPSPSKRQSSSPVTKHDSSSSDVPQPAVTVVLPPAFPPPVVQEPPPSFEVKTQRLASQMRIVSSPSSAAIWNGVGSCTSFINKKVTIGSTLHASFHVSDTPGVVPCIPTSVGVLLLPPTQGGSAASGMHFEHLPLGLHTHGVGLRLDLGVIGDGTRYSTIYPFQNIQQASVKEQNRTEYEVTVDITYPPTDALLVEWGQKNERNQDVINKIADYRRKLQSSQKSSHVVKVQFSLKGMVGGATARTFNPLLQTYFADASDVLVGVTFGHRGVSCTLTKWELSPGRDPRTIIPRTLLPAPPALSQESLFTPLVSGCIYPTVTANQTRYYIDHDLLTRLDGLYSGILHDCAVCDNVPTMIPITWPGIGRIMTSQPRSGLYKLTVGIASPDSGEGWDFPVIGFGRLSKIKNDPSHFRSPFGNRLFTIGYMSSGKIVSNQGSFDGQPWEPTEPITVYIDLNRRIAFFYVSDRFSGFYLNYLPTTDADLVLGVSLPRRGSIIFVSGSEVSSIPQLPSGARAINWTGGD